jgi:hypothetical protein
MLFLSHSSKDKPTVRTLASHLIDAGFPTWLDEWKIRIGECIATGIEDGLTECRFVIVALSPQAVSSGWVDREWKAKYWQEVEEERVRILPVLIEKCEVPMLLRTKRYADLSTDYTQGFQQLVKSINGYLAEDAATDFYAYAPIVAKQLVMGPITDARNKHWDSFDSYVSSLRGTDRFKVQKLNCLQYLNKWGLTVTQLRKELCVLGFPTPEDEEFSEDLVMALEDFQRTHCMRHVDGFFGELTYRQMYELHRSRISKD